MIYQFAAAIQNGAVRTVLVHHSVQTIDSYPDICTKCTKCFRLVK